MAITHIPITCPKCGATIDAPVSQDECLCANCGTRVLINNENVKTTNINKHIEKTTHVVDEDEAAKANAKREQWALVAVCILVPALLFLERCS